MLTYFCAETIVCKGQCFTNGMPYPSRDKVEGFLKNKSKLFFFHFALALLIRLPSWTTTPQRKHCYTKKKTFCLTSVSDVVSLARFISVSVRVWTSSPVRGKKWFWSLGTLTERTTWVPVPVNTVSGLLRKNNS